MEFDDNSPLNGVIHISEDVIVELTRKTLVGIDNINLVSSRLSSKFGLGRKSGDGIRVSVNQDDKNAPLIYVDVYVLVKYGKRIPDLAWDVQEKIKANLERYTGYSVAAVNVNVQGIYLDEPELASDDGAALIDQVKVLEPESAEAVVNEPEPSGVCQA